MSKLERELAKLEGKLNRGEISDDIFHATKERLETEAASKSAVASTGTIVQQEKEAWDIVRNTQRSRSSGSPSSEAPIVKPVQDDPLAELIAMRAKGEISGEEFARARKLLEPKKAEEPPPVTASVKKISDRDAALQALAARYKAADGHLPQSDNPAPESGGAKVGHGSGGIVRLRAE